jgi:Family of unknown function (DUF6159)
LGYVSLWFVATFMNTALAGTVFNYQSTGQVSLSAGFSKATSRLPQILAWALFAATIGILLKLLTNVLENYLSWFGSLIGYMFEAGFALATFFIAPVLAVEGVGPLTAIKRSGQIIKARWGQSVGAEFSLFWVLWPLHLIGLTLLLAFAGRVWGFKAVGSGDLISLAFGSAFIAYLVLVFVLQGVMSSIVTTRLYVYATSGQTPRGSNASTYSSAFIPKK